MNCSTVACSVECSRTARGGHLDDHFWIFPPSKHTPGSMIYNPVEMKSLTIFQASLSFLVGTRSQLAVGVLSARAVKDDGFTVDSVTSPRRIEEVGLTRKVVSAIAELARSGSSEVKEAVCRAAGHLALAESQGQLPTGLVVGALVPIFVSLLSADQASEVQRRQLHVRLLSTHPQYS